VSQIDSRLTEALNKVLVPGIMRSLVQMNLVRSAGVSEGKANVTLASTAIPVHHHESLKDRATAALTELPGVGGALLTWSRRNPRNLIR
jgi:metal-sulfur cluster biosynthetic enzyme